MIYGPRAVPVISVLEHLNQDLDGQELIHGKPGPRLDLLIFKLRQISLPVTKSRDSRSIY